LTGTGNSKAAALWFDDPAEMAGIGELSVYDAPPSVSMKAASSLAAATEIRFVT
jgi:hypothetical protein